MEYIRSFIAYCYYPKVEASYTDLDGDILFGQSLRLKKLPKGDKVNIAQEQPPMGLHHEKKHKTFDIAHFDLFGSDH